MQIGFPSHCTSCLRRIFPQDRKQESWAQIARIAALVALIACEQRNQAVIFSDGVREVFPRIQSAWAASRSFQRNKWAGIAKALEGAPVFTPMWTASLAARL